MFLNYVHIDVAYILLSCLFLNIQLYSKFPLSPVLMLFLLPNLYCKLCTLENLFLWYTLT